ncbi:MULTISPECIES: hypothetical protein [Nostoc]|uniref:Uncharacterized protein n=1 Tax=Nostoc paludosum FACHB-159 TaxID=2692908 RepID=A0ABR8K6M6_9NOSO|nr:MULTISPECIES: hypothetical protein [Nostoc]MBD2735110.1 hypothetical protein [Nostoc paludosum FACHB-159]
MGHWALGRGHGDTGTRGHGERLVAICLLVSLSPSSPHLPSLQSPLPSLLKSEKQ